MIANPRHISMDDFDYDLPAGRIAQFPVDPRDGSKLLVWKEGRVHSAKFTQLPSLLPRGSLVIFNETRVIMVRLIFHKASGAPVEIFCLSPAGQEKEMTAALAQPSPVSWQCLVGNARRWKQGPLLAENRDSGNSIRLKAEKIQQSGAEYSVRFNWDPEGLSFAGILEIFGKVPLPPYIRREPGETDKTKYQTVYARQAGSVAAPTAGLHFTVDVMNSLTSGGMELEKITLHVGAGTFKPVTTGTLERHEMHSEQVSIPISVVKRLAENSRQQVILVGTTTVRTIESLYWQGIKWLKDPPVKPVLDIRQWDPYDMKGNRDIAPAEAIGKVLAVMEENGLERLAGTTSLLIAPGYDYKLSDAILTNFHQPRSTLLLLVAAFVGPEWRNAYRFALDHEFRFLSYGDACLFFRNKA